MRIQEMRSGLPHLRKKLAAGKEQNFFAAKIAREAFIESLIEFIDSAEPEILKSEIDRPVWSVVSFHRVEANGLTYASAAKLIDELTEKGVNGLCIVTDAAASHIAR